MFQIGILTRFKRVERECLFCGVYYEIMTLNPITKIFHFSDSSTYVIYAHVLRQICVLDADEQQIMITWLRQIPSKDFQGLLTRLRTFVNYKLFPTKNDIPAGEKSAWWIPNGVKVRIMHYCIFQIIVSIKA